MASEPITISHPGEFTPAHIAILAEKLRWYIESDLDHIAQNSGRVSGIRWSERELNKLSDGEITAYLAGIRSAA